MSAPLDPALAHDSDGLVSASCTLRATVDRDNLIVQIPATEAGTEATAECLAQGLGVDSVLICSTQQCDRSFDAFLAGTERALIMGQPLENIRTVLSCPVNLVDGTSASPMASVAMARLLYRMREQRLNLAWWQVLRANYAYPPTLLWTEPQPRHAAQLVGWNTAMAFTLRTLEETAHINDMAGDTLLYQHRDGRDELARIDSTQPDPITADQAVAAELTRRRRTWNAPP
ncbi:transaldolase family protein [Streptomyces sp. NPDC002779]|uniref:transaldolase family protein n=1 Tax=Streptomyces sp. NPDC002779 TaxID=3364664 RepID=UPI003695E9CE